MIGIDHYPLARYLMNSSRGKARDSQTHLYEGEVAFAGVSLPETQTIQIDLDTDAPFLWIGLRGRLLLTAFNFAEVGDPDALVTFRIGGRGGKALMQTAVPWRNCMAARPVPFMLPTAKQLQAGGQIHTTIQLLGLAAPTPVIAQIQFYGAKVFGWRGKT